jgi:choline dehydrogenase-like flavoprotein
MHPAKLSMRWVQPEWDNPKTSALNKYQQAHDVKNLFIVDAAPFPSQGDKNCTWTILALSMRASRHIVDLRNQGNSNSP